MYIPTGYLQVTHVFGGSGLPTGAVVSYGLVRPDGVSAAALAGFFHPVWAENILPHQSDDIDLRSTIVKFGPNDVGAVGQYDELIDGGNSGSGVGPAASVLVKKNTGLGGRKGRGRMYVPGINEDEIDTTGTISGGLQAAFQGGFDDLWAAYDTAENPVVLLHSMVLVDEGPPPIYEPPAEDPVLVTNFAVQALSATQRRRLRR